LRRRATTSLPRPGYVLIIAEKPKAARKIAGALGLKGFGRVYGVPYWYGYYRGEYVVVSSTAGHLFTLVTDRHSYPVFEYRWVPRWEGERGASFLKKFYSALKALARGAKAFVNACDYDIEGSVIGYLIIKELGDVRRAKRAKFSSLTPQELRKSFQSLMPLDWDMIESGLCRHELDWIWGINVSRAIMHMFRRVMSYRKPLSAGRVQSPALQQVINREIERRTHVPLPSYSVVAELVAPNGEVLKVDLAAGLRTREEARELMARIKAIGYAIVKNVVKKDERIAPNPPFNLPDLQQEASRIYGISPAEVLRLGEGLYLDGVISYPRTNSQKLPPTLDTDSILRSLGRLSQYSSFVPRAIGRRPVQGSKTDPAHPAIYPTGQLPKLPMPERKWRLYDLIVRRFIASFLDPVIVSTVNVDAAFDDVVCFKIKGRVVKSRGWLDIYPFTDIKETRVPLLSPGDELRLKSVKIKLQLSRAPKRYTKASLLRWMESVGIGTEATRAEIIETIVRRGYVEVKSGYLIPTELGFQVAFALSEFFSEITDVSLTRKFEEEVESVRLGRKRRADVVTEAKEFLEPRLNHVKELIDSRDRASLLRALKVVKDEVVPRCVICGRVSYGESLGLPLCVMHYIAAEKMCESYRRWREAEGISFGDFARRLLKMRSAGDYVREVAEYVVTHGLNISDK